MDYKEFLQNKRFVLESSGFDIDKSELNPMLYEFQKDIVRWALKKGKACMKESYYNQAVANLDIAANSDKLDCPVGQMSIEDFLVENALCCS